MSHRALIVAVLAACTQANDAPPDARPDAPCGDRAVVYAPIAVTGTSPAGPLDVFHYAVAYELGGFCLPSLQIALTRTMGGAACGDDMLLLGVQNPFDGTTPVGSGTLAATVTYNPYTLPTATTDQARFEVRAIDPVTAADVRVSGRFVTTDPAWSLDLSVDLVTQNAFFDCPP